MFERFEALPSRPFAYSRRHGNLYCENASIEKLVSRYGTGLYVYSSKHIVERYELFEEAFAGQPHLICYAVKANSNLSLLKLLAAQGAGFDIVSGGELQRVLEADRKAASRVVFSGVGKTVPEMDFALKAGIRLFNVESESELALLADRASHLRRRARIALRVNPDVFAETHPYISTGLSEHKFGIEMKKAAELYRRMAGHPYLEAAGISVHIGSQIRAAGPFAAAVSRVVELVQTLRAEGIPIRSIDAGGGLGIDYTLNPAFDAAAAVHEYADGIRAALGGLKVELLLEPGRFLVAQAGALITRVLYIKKNGARTFVIVDAGMNDLIRPALYQAHHEIIPVQLTEGEDDRKLDDRVDIVGPVCETGDFFARDRALPKVQPGDLLAILDAGAYGMSLSSNYNSRPRPAEVLVSGRKAREIRRRETMRDLLAAER